MTAMTAKQYRKHWATLTGRSEHEVYVPDILRKRLRQCEGCELPLGAYLDDGYEMQDFYIDWVLCEYHEPVPDHFDDYWYEF